MLQTFNISTVSYFKRDTGWFVAQTAEGETVVGFSIIPPYGLITVEAEKKIAPRFGEQWVCKEVKYNDIEDVTLALLSSGLIDGVKEGKAEDVFKAFGSELWTILDAAVKNEEGIPGNEDLIEFRGRKRNPDDLLQDAKGVGPKVAVMMIQSWKKERHVFTSAIGAIRCGLTVMQFQRVLKGGEHERFYSILHNIAPYSIYDLVTFGVAWEKADQLAQEEWPDKPAIPWDSPVRFAGAVKHIMKEWTQEGHMCAPIAEVEGKVAEMLGYPNAFEMIKDPEEHGLKLFLDHVYLKDDYHAEVDVAGHLKRIFYAPGRTVDISNAQIRDMTDIDLNPQQMDAVQMALTSKISLITGGPGVGKTTILKVLCEILRDKGIEIDLCAFMGAAARRMQFATGVESSTLHSRLRLFADKSEREFIKGGYLIIDEMSTVPMDLLADVLRQCYDQVSIVFIGDADQLPPVGRGEGFMQLLNSFIPKTRLTQIYRNRGIISAACHDVNSGQMPSPDNLTFFMAHKCPEGDMQKRITQGLEYFRKNGWARPQIITPLNSKAQVGRADLNKMMQELLNPNGEVIPQTNIRVGDTVVVEKNNYNLGVRNGMIGQCIARTDEARLLLEKKDTDEPWMSKDAIPLMVVLFEEDGQEVVFTTNEIKEVNLGYAITAHKSQGNQFSTVFVVIPYLPAMLSMRQIIYTAMSRARERLFVLSAPGAMESCIKNTARMRRNSNLSVFIDEMQLEMEEA